LALSSLLSPWVKGADDGPEDEIPAAPGAYLLAVWVPGAVALPPRLVTPERIRLNGGWLVYAGSARGSGGLQARIKRHLRADKPRRWHVDWLTTAPGAKVWVCPAPGGDECTLLEAVRGLPGAWVPVPYFGSSDCAVCPAHLLALSE